MTKKKIDPLASSRPADLRLFLQFLPLFFVAAKLLHMASVTSKSNAEGSPVMPIKTHKKNDE